MVKQQTITFAALRSQQGELSGTSHWITIDQPMLSAFAQITGDDAFIHTDPARAAMTRFGGTIAHGLLLLSLLPAMLRTALPAIADKKMGVNYGYDRVRFTGSVPVNSRVRGSFTFQRSTARNRRFHVLDYDVRIEIEGSDQPVLVAAWKLGAWIAADP
ncbi:MaoC family dehydratase [Pseudomonas bharatica]|uniref:MaoC family dehydratase n=1 Tax=Pseudomonas bharatica TaxID=2692112 RepID=UPI003B27B56F